MLFWAVWPAPIRRGSIPDRGHGVKKRCWGRQGNMFLVNFVVFYRKNASPVPTPVQIEALVSESVCFTNCFYLKRTRLYMDLGLLLFEKIIEYLLKKRPVVYRLEHTDKTNWRRRNNISPNRLAVAAYANQYGRFTNSFPVETCSQMRWIGFLWTQGATKFTSIYYAQMLHGAGKFTYIYPKKGPVL